MHVAELGVVNCSNDDFGFRCSSILIFPNACISGYQSALHASFFPAFKRAPKWLRRPSGVSFGFGGKLVTFGPRKSANNSEVRSQMIDSRKGRVANVSVVSWLDSSFIEGLRIKNERTLLVCNRQMDTGQMTHAISIMRYIGSLTEFSARRL